MQLEEILLVDDSEADNFIHRRVITKAACANRVAVCEDGQEALDYLASTRDAVPPRPSLIFLDINMPRMDGWEFLKAYESAGQANSPVVVMLTTSCNPDDRSRAESYSSVSAFLSKPLSRESLGAVLQTLFPAHGC